MLNFAKEYINSVSISLHTLTHKNSTPFNRFFGVCVILSPLTMFCARQQVFTYLQKIGNT
jgi:hypothetical protein